MKTTSVCRLGFLAGLVYFLAAPAHAGSDSSDIECLKSAQFLAPPDSPEHFKYAPDREVAVMHLALDVTPDFQRRTVAGQAVWRFKPIAKPVREVKLDAVDLNIQSVASSAGIQGYQAANDQVTITFTEPLAVDQEASVTIVYTAEPTLGLYFRTPEMGYKPGDAHLFTQGEEIEARHWYPCFDSPNEKFTSEITCHAPEGMTVISNGRLISQEKEGATGLVATHWSQEKPHANYLITLVAGYLGKIEDRYKDVPLGFYTPASEIREATNSFRDTKDIMGFFEQEIGVPYPWPKYDQICVNDFVAGGMENTSATTLTDGTLFTSASENIRSSEGLISHEMAHQWFGDLVTCKDWSHIWLNEGFATYYQVLYDGHKNGRDAMLLGLYRNAMQIIGASNDLNAIVRRSYDKPREMFSYLSYPKGAWVLHMLRSQLGEDLYRRCIRTYLERHSYGNVVTEDLRAVIEELSGRPYDQFFDQWLYHGHYPELEINSSWDERDKLEKITVRQTQALNESVLLFQFPLAFRFKGKFGTTNQAVNVKNKQEDFYFPLESAPEIVRADPDYTLLAKITFNAPEAMLDAELADKDDMVGRLLAVEQLAGKRDKAAAGKLKRTLNGDPFYGVRAEAARALRMIHSDEALEALLASTNQADARVRLAVVNAIGGFYRDSACNCAEAILDHEKNPMIQSVALRGLGGYARPEAPEIFIKYLNSQSYRNELADASIAGVRMQDDPAFIEPLLETLGKKETDFTSGGYGQALGTLAYLARNEEDKDEARQFLVARVTHKKENIRLAAIRALGGLGDPKAIAVLEKFAAASKESPERSTAEEAIGQLRAGRKPVDDFKNLRQEVLDLERSNRDLRKELDELKKQVEARPAPAAGVKPQKKSQPAKKSKFSAATSP